MLTIDLSSPDLENALSASQWLQFWQNTACWGGIMMTAEQTAKEAKGNPTGHVSTAAA